MPATGSVASKNHKAARPGESDPVRGDVPPSETRMRDEVVLDDRISG
jgi:hypothetical protein